MAPGNVGVIPIKCVLSVALPISDQGMSFFRVMIGRDFEHSQRPQM